MTETKLDWRQEGNVQHATVPDGVYSIRQFIGDYETTWLLVHTASADGKRTGIGADFPSADAAKGRADALAFPR